ncbi:hypothetical protein LTR62_005890 [Meristemomyces frigidus]|uniref:Proteasome maturation factor UMP1 n=1 Tax=Meristemomyces frigidus TaxID=1508187 RepID=A0AAN7THE7_9PEZI|nr:hypothetical protein LTR62_005890 [Meristemomyces frigidus]
MSLRIVPAAPHPSQTTSARGAPSAPGVHDTLRSNLSLTNTPAPKNTASSSSTTQSFHPLESRLSAWRAQQDDLKYSLLRRTYGIAEPVKRQMELSIVQAGEWVPGCLAGGRGGGLHADILAGRDCELDWEDVFDGSVMRNEVDFHAEMEGVMGMGW